MENKNSADSDYDFIKKMFKRLTLLERSREVTPKEARIIRSIQTRWTADGVKFALGKSQRESLIVMVRNIDARLNIPPYPRFC